MKQANQMVTNNNWFPKPLTSTMLSVFVAILTGIVINLLTNDLPANDSFLFFFIWAVILLILSSISSFVILKIRISVDDILAKKTLENEKTIKDKRVGQDELWKSTLECTPEDKKIFIKWKRIGLISMVLGLTILLVINFKIRIENIDQFKYKHEIHTEIIDSISYLKRELSKQEVLVLILTDSIQRINRNIEIINKK